MIRSILLPLILTTTITCLSQEQQPSLGGGWQKDAKSGEYINHYPGKGWGGMSWKLKLEPNHYYKLSCKAKSDIVGSFDFGLSIALGNDKAQAGNSFLLSNQRTPCTLYFYSHDKTEGMARFYVSGKECTIRINHLKLEKLSEKDFSTNLLPDGDFENSATYPIAWKNGWGVKEFHGGIVSNQGFMAGEKNLQLKDEGLLSHNLPMRPGYEYELKFWGKAEKEKRIRIIVQVWPQFKRHIGKHFYVQETCRLTSDWTEFKLHIAIPTNDSEFPDLHDRSGNLMLIMEDKGTKAWLDYMSFCEIKRIAE